MKRTLKFNLNLANNSKKKTIEELFEEYKRAVNYYLSVLSSQKKYILSEKEVKSFTSLLSYRYKQCAKRQAIKIWKSWRRNKKKGELPEFRGSLILDSRFIRVEKAKNTSFDYWLRLATLNKNYPISLPIKSYNWANQYFQDWKLLNGGRIKKENNSLFLLLTFEKETPEPKQEGKVIGLDIGIKKLIVDSEGNNYGQDIERLMTKIQKKEQGSKTFKRALKERDYYVNQIVKELPFEKVKAFIIENIKNIKKGIAREKRLRKSFRSKFQRWTYSQLLKRIKLTAEATGVHLQLVSPAYTSQTCSQCGAVHKLNRKNELFLCRNCGYTEDADYNASKNILKSYLAQQSMVAGSAKAFNGINVH